MLRIRLFALEVVCRYHRLMAHITGNTLHGCTCDEGPFGFEYCPHVQIVDLQHEVQRRRELRAAPQTPYSRVLTRRELFAYDVLDRLMDYEDRLSDREYEKAGQPTHRKLTIRERVVRNIEGRLDRWIARIAEREWAKRYAVAPEFQAKLAESLRNKRLG